MARQHHFMVFCDEDTGAWDVQEELNDGQVIFDTATETWKSITTEREEAADEAMTADLRARLNVKALTEAEG